MQEYHNDLVVDSLKDIVERLKNLPDEEKMRLAQLASEAGARRRAKRGN